MPDELPPAAAPVDDASKAQTIRITLPPNPDLGSTVKRETVRIEIPAKTAPSFDSGANAPKKETTRVSIPEVAPATPSLAKPFTPPPPPRPPSQPGMPPPQSGMPLPPQRPQSGVTAPPKPPSLAPARPTVPLKPAPSASGALPSPLKPGAPKKETARISLPADGATKPVLPKATVKIQQTQPLINRPSIPLQPARPSITDGQSKPSLPTQPSSGEVAPDSLVNGLAIAALVLAIGSLTTVILAYLSSNQA